MAILIDTNIAIHIRDGDEPVIQRVGELRDRPALSIMSVVELEAGVFRSPDLAHVRRAVMNAMLARFQIFGLDRDVVAAYGTIVAALGFSRTRVIDRLIAATAIVNDLTLITINEMDFRDIPGLTLEIWPSGTS